MYDYDATKTVEKLSPSAFQRFLSRQKRTQREKVMIQNKPGDGNGKAPKIPKFLMVRWPHGPLWGTAEKGTRKSEPPENNSMEIPPKPPFCTFFP